jgi:hypothetical protein
MNDMLRYVFHKSFNFNSSSARIRKPITDADKALALKNKAQSLRAKSNVGPNGKPKLKEV